MRAPLPALRGLSGWSWTGRWLAVLALAVQLAAGALTPFAVARAMPVLGNVPICHSGDTDRSGASDNPLAPPRHDCVVCPLCHLAGHGVALPPPAPPGLTGPLPFDARIASLPPTDAAPPRPSVAHASPRGPPPSC